MTLRITVHDTDNGELLTETLRAETLLQGRINVEPVPALPGRPRTLGAPVDLVVDIPLIAGAVAAVVRAVTRYLIERERQRRDPGWKIIIHAEDSVEINADRVRSADIRELVELIVRNGHRDAGE